MFVTSGGRSWTLAESHFYLQTFYNLEHLEDSNIVSDSNILKRVHRCSIDNFYWGTAEYSFNSSKSFKLSGCLKIRWFPRKPLGAYLFYIQTFSIIVKHFQTPQKMRKHSIQTSQILQIFRKYPSGILTPSSYQTGLFQLYSFHFLESDLNDF